jgi:hypothetical protein
MSVPTNKPVGFFHRERGDLIKICGRFEVTSPNISAQVGQGFVASHTGAGDYLLTFTGAASAFISGTVTLEKAVPAADLYGQIGAFTAGGAAAATLQIRTKVAGANTTVAAGDWVHFEVTLYGECLAT